MRGDDGRRIDDGIALEQRFFAIGRIDPHRAAGRRSVRSSLRPASAIGWPLRVHDQQHAGPQFAAAGLDFFDADNIGVGRQLQIILNAHRGHDEAHIAGQLAAQALDLIGQALPGFAVDQAEQGIAEFKADHDRSQSGLRSALRLQAAGFAASSPLARPRLLFPGDCGERIARKAGRCRRARRKEGTACRARSPATTSIAGAQSERAGIAAELAEQRLVGRAA